MNHALVNDMDSPEGFDCLAPVTEAEAVYFDRRGRRYGRRASTTSRGRTGLGM